MTPAQEAFQAAKLPLDLIFDLRKDAHEALHPETKHGENQHTRSRQVGDSNAPDRFTADTAAKTGQSELAIQREAERDRGQAQKSHGETFQPNPARAVGDARRARLRRHRRTALA